MKKPLCLYAGKIKELQLGDSVLNVTTVEVDLGAVPRLSGAFTLPGTGLSGWARIHQAALAYTGKGTLKDEAEMDSVSVAASILNPTTIQAYWTASGFVAGNFKFLVETGV